MSSRLALGLAAVLFALLATANSGGYRYGVSDQAFYQPAVAIARTPSLFPRDREVLTPQTRFMLGDKLVAAMSRLTGSDLPGVFLAIYALTLAALFAAGIALARSLGVNWWTVAVFLALLTLRHRIAKTGANSLEGYMHLRMLAFACGLAGLAWVARRRFGTASAWTIVAAIIHTTTAVWFGAAVAIAFLWSRPRRGVWTASAGALALVIGTALAAGPLRSHLTIMDAPWLAVLTDKDYLFAAHWPAYAWATNLAYPAVLLLIYRYRLRLEVTAPGEAALVASLVALVVIFLISVPLTEWHIALAVQMQVNRVFWLLDAVVALYVAWWLMEGLARRASVRTRACLVAAMVAVAAGRGYYVLRIEAVRPLIEVGLPATPWVDAMTWLRTQPASWHVLADPEHAWKYGVSVRVAAERDTVLESSKDAALAMYDRPLALRVAERGRALANFDTLTAADLTALDRQFGLDVFVDRADRHFDWPILYRNDQFVIYDLR